MYNELKEVFDGVSQIEELLDSLSGPVSPEKYTETLGIATTRARQIDLLLRQFTNNPLNVTDTNIALTIQHITKRFRLSVQKIQTLFSEKKDKREEPVRTFRSRGYLKILREIKNDTRIFDTRYFKVEDYKLLICLNETEKDPLAAIDLFSVLSVEKHPTDPKGFFLIASKRRFEFQADSDAKCEMWIQSFLDWIEGTPGNSLLSEEATKFEEEQKQRRLQEQKDSLKYFADQDKKNQERKLKEAKRQEERRARELERQKREQTLEKARTQSIKKARENAVIEDYQPKPTPGKSRPRAIEPERLTNSDSDKLSKSQALEQNKLEIKLLLAKIEESKVNKLKLETEVQQLETYDASQDPDVAPDIKVVHAEKKKEVERLQARLQDYSKMELACQQKYNSAVGKEVAIAKKANQLEAQISNQRRVYDQLLSQVGVKARRLELLTHELEKHKTETVLADAVLLGQLREKLEMEGEAHSAHKYQNEMLTAQKKSQKSDQDAKNLDLQQQVEQNNIQLDQARAKLQWYRSLFYVEDRKTNLAEKLAKLQNAYFASLVLSIKLSLASQGCAVHANVGDLYAEVQDNNIPSSLWPTVVSHKINGNSIAEYYRKAPAVQAAGEGGESGEAHDVKPTETRTDHEKQQQQKPTKSNKEKPSLNNEHLNDKRNSHGRPADKQLTPRTHPPDNKGANPPDGTTSSGSDAPPPSIAVVLPTPPVKRVRPPAVIPQSPRSSGGGSESDEHHSHSSMSSVDIYSSDNYSLQDIMEHGAPEMPSTVEEPVDMAALIAQNPPNPKWNEQFTDSIYHNTSVRVSLSHFSIV